MMNYCCKIISQKKYQLNFQQGIFPNALSGSVTNLQDAPNRIWTCTKQTIWPCWRRLWVLNHHTIAPKLWNSSQQHKYAGFTVSWNHLSLTSSIFKWKICILVISNKVCLTLKQICFIFPSLVGHSFILEPPCIECFLKACCYEKIILWLVKQIVMM